MLTAPWCPHSTGIYKHRTLVRHFQPCQPITAFHHAVCASEKQIEGGKEFLTAIEGLVQLFERAERESESKVGLWYADGKLSLADAMAGPCEQTPERT
jgi:hypothetical protein